MAEKKPVRPQPAHIIITFKNHPPVVIDASTTNCLFWGTKRGKEGYKLLEKMYEAMGEPEKAADVERIWKGEPKPGARKAKARGLDAEPEILPGVIVKSEDCIPEGEPKP